MLRILNHGGWWPPGGALTLGPRPCALHAVPLCVQPTWSVPGSCWGHTGVGRGRPGPRVHGPDAAGFSAQPLPTPAPLALPTPGSSHGALLLSTRCSYAASCSRADGWMAGQWMGPLSSQGSSLWCWKSLHCGPSPCGCPPPRRATPSLFVAMICLGSGLGTPVYSFGSDLQALFMVGRHVRGPHPPQVSPRSQRGKLGCGPRQPL